ncbi:hypothetical protein TNCV_700431 [Trichonephila clavipes]|nr:hypothetical protein TNCV_700431 [Trichonephila clavipes]
MEITHFHRKEFLHLISSNHARKKILLSINYLFTSESDSQLFPSYDLFSRSYGFDYDEGQTITQPPLPVSENTNQSNFCCEFCSKVFYRKRYLLDHLNIHTGERPYICEFCTKSFTQRASRNRHMKLCHPELLEASKLSASVGDSVSKK